MFWKQAGGPCIGHFLSGDLSYSPKFLDLPPYKPLPFGFPEIVTSLPPPDLTLSSRNYHFTRGFHCTKCGRLSCRYLSMLFCVWFRLVNKWLRYQWEKWQCSHCNVRSCVLPLKEINSPIYRNHRRLMTFLDKPATSGTKYCLSLSKIIWLILLQVNKSPGLMYIEYWYWS